MNRVGAVASLPSRFHTPHFRCLGSDGETTLEFRKVSKFTSILATGSVAELRLQWTGTKILGIRFSALTVAMGQTRGNYEKSRVAIYVDEVEKGSLADGTVQKGDIIVSVNGVMVVNKSMVSMHKTCFSSQWCGPRSVQHPMGLLLTPFLFVFPQFRIPVRQ